MVVKWASRSRLPQPILIRYKANQNSESQLVLPCSSNPPFGQKWIFVLNAGCLFYLYFSSLRSWHPYRCLVARRSVPIRRSGKNGTLPPLSLVNADCIAECLTPRFTLEREDQSAYFDAVNCLATAPSKNTSTGAVTRWEDLVATHQIQTNGTLVDGAWSVIKSFLLV